MTYVRPITIKTLLSTAFIHEKKNMPDLSKTSPQYDGATLRKYLDV